MRVHTRIMVETEEINIFRRRSPSIRGFCSSCEREVILVRPSEAARLVNEPLAHLQIFMSTNKVHYLLDLAAKPLICLVSLSSLDCYGKR